MLCQCVWIWRRLLRYLLTWKKILSPKRLVLVVLAVQTSVMVLLLRLSRSGTTEPYLITTAILLSEVLKFIMTLVLLLLQSGREISSAFKRLKNEVLFDSHETFKLSVPACLYVVQNNLLFIALSHLDAGTYQVTGQLKILTTAMFSRMILGRKLKMVHWLCLCLLMVGVALVQMGAAVNVATNELTSVGRKEERDLSWGFMSAVVRVGGSWLLGVSAVLTSCIISGFAGVYFECLLKRGAQPSLVTRNLQMGLFSMLFGCVAVCSDWRLILEKGFLQGYSPVVWAVLVAQALNGLVVSMTMKYADNILKCFATSISIVLSTLFSWLAAGDPPPSMQFGLGAAVVIAATVAYGVVPQPSVVPVNDDAAVIKV